MSHPNNNNIDSSDTSDNSNNEFINSTVNSFLQNITNSIYNNTFLDIDDSNTYFNETFMSDVTPLIDPASVPAQPASAPVEPSSPPPPPPPPSDPPIIPQPRNRTTIGRAGILPFNHPNIGGTAGNRFLLRPTHIRFSDILPDGTYTNRRYVSITPSMVAPINGNSVLNSVIQRSFNDDRSAFKQIISDAGKKLLKPVPFSSLDTEETKCTIMQEIFEDDTMVVELPCKHVFCEEAIMHWLENESATCPVCRKALPSKEIRVGKNSNVEQTTDVFENNDPPDTAQNDIVEDYEEDIHRVRSSSAPTLSNNMSNYYQSIINNITRIRDLTEEEDTQRAIWNSIANTGN